jgi:hypothetical protein
MRSLLTVIFFTLTTNLIASTDPDTHSLEGAS